MTHGDPADYANGCRRPACVQAHRAWVTEQRQASFAAAVQAALPPAEPIPEPQEPEPPAEEPPSF